MSSVDQLMDRGVKLKRSGDLEGAKNCYMKAIDIDPFNMMAFISLGKVSYLLGQQDLAIRCYLASTHLQLAPIERGIHENELPRNLKMQYDNFPQHILEQLPKKSAFTIYIDANTPRHVAHSIIDLSSKMLSEYPHLKPYSEIYQAHISGDGTHDRKLESWNLTSSDQIETDEEVYIPFGRNFVIQELQWNNLNRNDVIDMYF